ncbi:hypothetical protein [Algoriphagus aquaeductus]|nr:hypothetical protein [Algoriphagus aquaeductus]
MNLNNPILKRMHAMLHNITRNVVFYSSDMTPIDHQRRLFDSEMKTVLGIPQEVNNMYEYILFLGSDYSRLKMLTIVSACTDVEFLFKQYIENYFDTSAKKSKNFYQRLDDVNNQIFVIKGIDLNDFSFFSRIKLAFQVRHICIHNMGFIDEGFNQKTGLDLPIDSKFDINNTFINETFEAIDQLIGFLDSL